MIHRREGAGRVGGHRRERLPFGLSTDPTLWFEPSHEEENGQGFPRRPPPQPSSSVNVWDRPRYVTPEEQ